MKSGNCVWSVNIFFISLEELKHEKHDELPVAIRHFAAAVSLRPQLWRDETAVRHHFSLMGNKDDYVDTLTANVNSRLDFFNLWQCRVVGGISDLANVPTLDSEDNMSLEQLRVKSLVEAHENSDRGNSNNKDECAVDERDVQTLPSTSSHDWRKFLLIHAKPDTGKTYAVVHSIRKALEAYYRVLCATPTGTLSSTHNLIITQEGFSSDTIHSAFRYPVDQNQRPHINWDLANYDLIVIDELSMVPSTIFDHIQTTLQELHIRPVVLLCRDQQ